MSGYHELSLQQRSDWYSPAALSYERGRPKYPDSLVKRVIATSSVTASSRVLEIGAGPATATVAFAASGCALTALEPNKEFLQIAQEKCRSFANVTFVAITLEEWTLPTMPFDLAFSASAFHWVEPKTGYQKVADALGKGGCFALLWNKEPQPTIEVQGVLSRAYETISISTPLRFESAEQQAAIVHRLGNPARHCGLFKETEAFGEVVQIAYTTDEYLSLLQSFSSYINLKADLAVRLYKNLRQIIDSELGGRIELSYLSAAQIFVGL